MPDAETPIEDAPTDADGGDERDGLLRLLDPEASWLHTAGWVILEFVIVFSGVFAAFQLDQWQADRRAERRAQQAYTSLHRVISNQYAEDLRESARDIDSVYVEGFLRPFQQGKQPMPIPLQFTGGSLNTGGWDAILEAGGLDALDTDFVLEVETYFSGLQTIVLLARRATAMSNEHLLPHFDEGKTAFYHDETGRLRSEFWWYPRTVGRVASSVRNIAQETDSLLVHLERKIEPMER